MNKVLKCANMGFKCAWVATAKTENELMILIKDHANKCSNLKEITKYMTAKVKSIIIEQ
jgi:predicted small metal-binding protein